MAVHAPRYLLYALYAAAGLVVLDQAAELLVSLWPFDPSDLKWRFGAFGLVIGRVTTVVIADALVILAALGLGHRRLLRVWGWLHAGAAVLLLIGVTAFVLDAVELRTVTRPEAKAVFDFAAGRAVVLVLFAVVYCVWLLVASLRATRSSGPHGDPAVLVTEG